MHTTNKAYIKGYAFEMRVKKYFESIGYTVFRSAGSHSVADLIAFQPPFYPSLIQCKVGGTMSKKEKDKFCEVARKNNIVAILVSRNKKGRLVFEILWRNKNE